MAPNSTEDQIAGLVRDRERDRWLALQLAPAEARPALLALYAFHAEIARVRDAVTEPMIGHVRLQWWRETVEGAAAGTPRPHPVAEALVAPLAAGRLDANELMGLVDAREADLDPQGFATEAAFLAYLDATAGALDRASLGVLGVAAAPARTASAHAARAYGIAGQLRAAAANAARGRVLLPRDLLAAHGVTAAALLAGRPEPGLRDVARALAAQASAALVEARAPRREVPRAALPVLVLARFAARYLRRLAAAGHDPFSRALEPVPVAGPLHVLAALATGRY